MLYHLIFPFSNSAMIPEIYRTTNDIFHKTMKLEKDANIKFVLKITIIEE